MTLGKAFIKRLKEILDSKKIKSLHSFLKDNCIPRSTIINLENGNTKSPTLALVYRVAYALDMSPIEFLNDIIMLNDDIDFL